jgi:hypothetical protein
MKIAAMNGRFAAVDRRRVIRRTAASPETPPEGRSDLLPTTYCFDSLVIY